MPSPLMVRSVLRFGSLRFACAFCKLFVGALSRGAAPRSRQLCHFLIHLLLLRTVKNRQIGHGHKLTIVLSNYGVYSIA